MRPILLNQVHQPTIELLSSSPINQFLSPSNDITTSPYNSDLIIEARRAAEAHRRSRYAVQQILKPGVKLSEIINTIETSTRTLLKGELNDGIGFPTGVSLNECAAHFTLNPGDVDIVLTENDVLKIDFGTHVNGRIMDSAFTVAFNSRYENLLLASKEATEAGIKAMGIDVRVCDIGRIISEVMSGYEIEIDGKTLPIRAVENLNGHSIDQYRIHSGISIPNVQNNDHEKIVGNSFYAIETFATTGKGYVRNGPNCSHYIHTPEMGKPIRNEVNKKVLAAVEKNIGLLPFCPRYVDWYVKTKSANSVAAVRTISLLRNFEPYPPLYDSSGSYVAQFEHTLYLTEFGKEILTRGDDY